MSRRGVYVRGIDFCIRLLDRFSIEKILSQAVSLLNI